MCDAENSSATARTRSSAWMARRLVLRNVAPACQDALHLGPAASDWGTLVTDQLPVARVRGVLRLDPAGRVR